MSSRGPPPLKRGPPIRDGGPPPKRSAPSGPMGRRKCLDILLGECVELDVQPNLVVCLQLRCLESGILMAPRRLAEMACFLEGMITRLLATTITARRTGGMMLVLSADSNCFFFPPRCYSQWHSLPLSYSSRDYLSSRDTRDYAPPPRDYPYRDYSSSRDDYGSLSRGYGYFNFSMNFNPGRSLKAFLDVSAAAGTNTVMPPLPAVTVTAMVEAVSREAT